MKITAKDNVCYLSDGRLEIFTPQKYLGSSSHIDGDKVLAIGLNIFVYPFALRKNIKEIE